jgi:glucosamine-6-phosphate deaminase
MKFPRDIQLLGIGRNGHIAFNEPGTKYNSITRVVELTESTIEANSRFYNNDITKVPTKALTMGISEIFDSKKIILVAFGYEKAEAVSKMFKYSEDCPASILGYHPDTTVIIDKDAASLIEVGVRCII